MIALCGCDFSRNLPRLGESSIWKSRHVFRHCDLSSVDGMLSALALLYIEVFKRSVNFGNLLKVPENQTGFEYYDAVSKQIHATEKVSPKIRNSVWTAEVAECHCRNVSWTLRYWEDRSAAPFPMVEEFGFGYGKNKLPIYLK